MKIRFFLCFFALLWTVSAQERKDFYTQPKPGAGGGITAEVDCALSHAIAIERDRTSVYMATLSNENMRLHFTNLPTGKYDLLLLTKEGTLFEGLQLGDPAESITGERRKTLEERIARADAFFNKYRVHRMGLIEGGGKLLALIERMRDKEALTGGGELLAGPVRRLEIAQFDKAADTWSFRVNRHLHREVAAAARSDFLESKFVAALGNLRVIESVKDLGSLPLKP